MRSTLEFSSDELRKMTVESRLILAREREPDGSLVEIYSAIFDLSSVKLARERFTIDPCYLKFLEYSAASGVGRRSTFQVPTSFAMSGFAA